MIGKSNQLGWHSSKIQSPYIKHTPIIRPGHKRPYNSITSERPIMFLERLYFRLGKPAWFYPAVMLVILVVLPCLVSSFE